MTTRREIKSNHESIRLVVASQTKQQRLDESKLSAVQPAELAAGLQLATTTKNAVWVVPGQQPTTIEPSLAAAKMGEGRAAIRRLQPGVFEIVAEKVIEAIVYRNGSAARSLRATHDGSGWTVAD